MKLSANLLLNLIKHNPENLKAAVIAAVLGKYPHLSLGETMTGPSGTFLEGKDFTRIRREKDKEIEQMKDKLVTLLSQYHVPPPKPVTPVIVQAKSINIKSLNEINIDAGGMKYFHFYQLAVPYEKLLKHDVGDKVWVHSVAIYDDVSFDVSSELNELEVTQQMLEDHVTVQLRFGLS